MGNRRHRGRHLWVATLSCAALLGCGEDTPGHLVDAPLVLTAVSDMVTVKPGGPAPASFLLTGVDGTPVAGQRVDFAAIDDPLTPASELAGATLSASSGLTDAKGIATVTVTGGLRTVFRLTARHVRSEVAQTIVTVGEGEAGTINVVAGLAAGSNAGPAVVSVDILLFDALSCAQVPLIKPPPSLRRPMSVAPGTPVSYGILSTMSYAALGHGRDAGGRLRAVGCVDVPAGTVRMGSTAQVYLPLSDLEPVPQVSFAVSSRFSLARREIVRKVAGPWQDLGDCPLDPGQLWLDCAIDGLGSPPGDALDCVPAPTGEGELAGLISARRGSTSATSPCRAATVAGVQTLDAKVAAMFPSPAQPPASDVDALGMAVANMFDDITLGSMLDLGPTATRGVFQATHTLRTILFAVGNQSVLVDIVAQGIPSAQARLVPVTTAGELLTVETHNLGLHLGTLARVAFRRAALGIGQGPDPATPAATVAYLDRLFGLASSGTGAARVMGCDALDAVVCADAGSVAGCLRAACVAGQAALAARLDAAFAALDGDDADLQLSGSAVMTDADQDGVAEQLGGTANNPGLWAGQIRAHGGTETISGSWVGMP